MNKNITFSIIVLLIIGIGMAYYINSSKSVSAPAQISQEQAPAVQTTIQPGTASSSPTITAPRKAVTVKVPTINISIANFAFLPRVIIIDKGNKVVWTNNDSTTHQVAGAGVLDGPVIAKGQTYSYTFTKAGTYNYHCNIHPSMAGTIIVK